VNAADLDGRRERVLGGIVGVCSLSLFAALAWPLVTGRVFVLDDLRNFHLPLRYLYANALRAGHLLLWTPAVYGGVYLHAEGQLGMLHPLHLVLYRLFRLQVAFNVELLTSYVAAYAGMYWLLRRLGLRPASSLTGAMLFAFSGFNLLHHHHMNLVAVTAHLPWLLACEDVLMTAPNRRQWLAGFAGVSLVVASAVLLGFPQALWWDVLAAAAFAGFRAWETGRWRRLIVCAIAGVEGILLGAVQLVPTLDAAAHSVRSALDPSFALSYSLSPWNVFQLWAPGFFVKRGFTTAPDFPQPHEVGIYSGTFVIIALLWLAMRRGSIAQRRLVAAGSIFAAFMFVLALGSHGGIARLLTYLPGLGSLRAPARYIMLVQFALSILGAIAFEDLVHGVRAPAWLTPRRMLGLCAVSIASVLTVALGNSRIVPLPGMLPLAVPANAATGTAIVAAVTLAYVLAAARVRGAAALLIVVTAGDLAWWGMSYVYLKPAQGIFDEVAALPRPNRSPRRVRVTGLADFPVMRGFDVVPGYLGLYPATPIAPASDTFRRLAGADAALTDDKRLLPLDGAMPRARLTTSGGEEMRGASADVLIDEPGHLAIRTVSDSAGILVLTERFDAGWRVEVGRTAATPIASDGGFLAIGVPPGTGYVEFRFAPRSFVIGAALSAAGALLLVAVMIFGGRVRTIPA